MVIITCPTCGAKNRIDERRAAQLQPKCGKCGTRLALDDSVAGGTEPLVVSDATWDRDVLGVRGVPVLVDAWAPWCGPCRMLAPTIDQLARESAGRYRVAKFNTDENPRVASQLRIDSIPTLLVYRDGREVDRIVGLQPKPAIAQRLAAAAAAAT